MMKKIKVILCGYSWTGCEALRQLLSKGYEVFVYTHVASQHESDLASYCEELEVNYSFDKITVENLPFIPDIISSIYYKFLISKEVIDSVEGRIFNLHPSLLPAYRGCSSLTWAMINGEKTVGFTYHFIDQGCDTGNIIIQNKITIESFDTQQTLYHRVMVKAMERYSAALNYLEDGLKGVVQEGKASFYNRGAPHSGNILIEWSDDYKKRFIRAMINPPYPYACFMGIEITKFSQLSLIDSECKGNQK